ncbi:unnamed protein product [Prorocentrum cordatum]|uniref:Uncharacterized protein n=1 Tax=Prorocentrum cordatum TaxID=2364126 RepID=A0ABN9SSM6_9DINO|nr:unnamed protein product [Polarella glacialis]
MSLLAGGPGRLAGGPVRLGGGGWAAWLAPAAEEEAFCRSAALAACRLEQVECVDLSECEVATEFEVDTECVDYSDLAAQLAQAQELCDALADECMELRALAWRLRGGARGKPHDELVVGGGYEVDDGVDADGSDCEALGELESIVGCDGNAFGKEKHHGVRRRRVRQGQHRGVRRRRVRQGRQRLRGAGRAGAHRGVRRRRGRQHGEHRGVRRRRVRRRRVRQGQHRGVRRRRVRQGPALPDALGGGRGERAGAQGCSCPGGRSWSGRAGPESCLLGRRAGAAAGGRAVRAVRGPARLGHGLPGQQCRCRQALGSAGRPRGRGAPRAGCAGRDARGRRGVWVQEEGEEEAAQEVASGRRRGGDCGLGQRGGGGPSSSWRGGRLGFPREGLRRGRAARHRRQPGAGPGGPLMFVVVGLGELKDWLRSWGHPLIALGTRLPDECGVRRGAPRRVRGGPPRRPRPRAWPRAGACVADSPRR